jgi:apolipoprotein N-acyltransferase
MAAATTSNLRQSPPTSHRSRLLLGLLLGTLSAVFLILAFPPYNVWPLIFLAFAPMLLADYRVLPERWAGLGSAIGWGVWLFVYLTMLFGLQADTWFMQAIAVLVAVVNLTGGRGLRRFHERSGYCWFVPFGILATVGIEMARSFIPIVATHAFVGHTLHTQPWLIQPASVFGIYGLDAVIMLVGYGLALGSFGLFDRRWQRDLPESTVDRRLSSRWLAWMGIVAAAWVSLSLILLNQAPKDPATIRVGGVQHGYVRPGHMDPDTQVARLEALSNGTRQAAAQGARLVVWPELGVGFDPQAEGTDELRALAAETGTSILIGYGLDTEAGWRNEAVMLIPQGQFLDVYGKNYPAGEPHIVTSGRYLVYDTPLGRLAPIICNDVNYTAAVRIPARMGAQLVMVPTRMFAGVWQEMQVMAVFRAVENRVSTVMVDGAFRTTMVDPYGRIVADQVTPEAGPLALVADVPVGSPGTLYSRLGDWVGWFCLLGWIGSMIYQAADERRSKKAGRATAASG